MALSGVPPEQRLLFGNSKGLPWWGSLVLALGLALVSAIAELVLSDSIGRVFEGASFIGCVAAVCLARRNSLFCPMVQPPLIIGLVGPAVMFVLADVDGGLQAKLIAVANPLINSFPAMAVTTGVTLAIGIGRLVHARRARAKSTELRDEDHAGGRAAERRRKPPEREQRSSRERPSGATESRRQQRPAGSGERKKPSPQQRESTTRKQPPPRTGSGSRREPPERGERGNRPRRQDDSGRNPRPRPSEGQRQGQQRKPRRRPDDE